MTSVLDKTKLKCATCGAVESEHAGPFPCGFGAKKLPKGGSSTAPLKAGTPVNGACPQCGAPVYAPDSIKDGEAPKAVYSCECWRKKSVNEIPMETK